MRAEAVLLVFASYFLGAIPTAYLVGRWLRGIDLRRYGSGTVSGSMAYEHVAHWVIVPIGIFDVAKAALPTWLGLRLGLGVLTAAAAGLAASVGHNWPPYLGFTGGRGLGTFLGVMLVLFPWGVAWLLGFLAIGYLLGDSAPWALASLITMPLFARLLDGPPEMPAIAVAMALLTLIKRVEANRRPLPTQGPERRRVLLRRALLDRDIADHAAWIHRRPEENEAPPS